MFRYFLLFVFGFLDLLSICLICMLPEKYLDSAQLFSEIGILDTHTHTSVKNDETGLGMHFLKVEKEQDWIRSSLSQVCRGR